MKKLLLSISIFYSAATFAQSPCTDLFFSEYIEGTSNNKALEIYNPTLNTVNLNGYFIYRANNGSAIYQDTLALTGSIAPGDVYLIANPSADSILVSQADTTHTITFYNGDDVLNLFNTNTMIDAIGELGVDPGTNWPVDTGATSEFTLVRKASVQAGTTNWTTGATQWDVYPLNDFSHFGAHTMTACTGGIENETGWELNVYPNPSSGSLNITSEVNDYTLQIFDLTGKLVINKLHLSENTQVDLTHLNNGIYLIKVNNGTHQLTKKVILKK